MGCDIGYGYLHRIPGDRYDVRTGNQVALDVKEQPNTEKTPLMSGSNAMKNPASVSAACVPQPGEFIETHFSASATTIYRTGPD